MRAKQRRRLGLAAGLAAILAAAAWEGGDAVDVTAGLEADVPSKPFGGAEEIAFAPGGESVVFTARVVTRRRQSRCLGRFLRRLHDQLDPREPIRNETDLSFPSRPQRQEHDHMLATQSIVDAFNAQLGRELGASHQYISIASYFDAENLGELSKFFFRQSEEEREHAMKFVRFVLDVEGKVVVPQIPAPKSDFQSARDAVGAALEWEKEVTDQIYRLVELCQKEKNHIALRFLDWFVNEQLEEVTLMSSLLGVVERAGEDNLLYVEDFLVRHGVPGEGEEA